MGRMKRLAIIFSTVFLMGVQSHEQDTAYHSQAMLEAESSDAAVETVSENVEVVPTPAPVNEPVPVVETIPDFRAMKVVSEKKRAFLDFLAPKVHAANEAIRADRAWLMAAATQVEAGLSGAELAQLKTLARKYRVTMKTGTPVAQVVSELLLRADVIPVSLVLAQGATESGWGTSRFAIEGNNYFGIWCFSAGCGLTPLSRDKDRTHQVARFETVADSVSYYMHNINTHRAYRTFRQLRATLNPSDPAGIVLADGLQHYSERGDEYVQDIKGMIRYNQLARFNP